MVMNNEANLLRDYGHDIRVYERTNAEILKCSTFGKIRYFKNMTWSEEGYLAIAKEIDDFKPELMHVHNYKFLLSPSIFKAAKDRGVATCLTLHNYRLACPAGMFLRNGRVCEDCLKGSQWRMLLLNCASLNPIKNFAQFYLYLGTKRRQYLSHWVDAYIALSEFGKVRFISSGVPQERVFVKTNFLFDPSQPSEVASGSDEALFVGRLSKEKGVSRLIDAWRDINFPLKIIGDGPLINSLKRQANTNVNFVGKLPHAEVLKQINCSSFLVFPSIWYEGCPMTLIEAMAIGKPIVASNLGPRSEMIKDGYNGFLYEINDKFGMQGSINRLIKCKKLREIMGRNSRKEYLAKFAPDSNYNRLLEVYSYAKENNSKNVKRNGR